MNSTRLAQAVAHREKGQFEAAAKILFELHAEEPDNPIISYQLAWLHDAQGLESEAVPYYEQAIQNGLSGAALRGALLGLGSTYRCLGQYNASVATLRKGLEVFPEAHEFSVFLAMALYNTGEYADAMALLLQTLVSTTQDEGIARYQKAILYYHDQLDQVWT